MPAMMVVSVTDCACQGIIYSYCTPRAAEVKTILGISTKILINCATEGQTRAKVLETRHKLESINRSHNPMKSRFKASVKSTQRQVIHPDGTPSSTSGIGW